jgi:DNA-binding transcriptional ArsR family regulator
MACAFTAALWSTTADSRRHPSAQTETSTPYGGGMPGDADIAAVASVLADRSRAAICQTLLDGRFRTAGELARAAAIMPSTASEHLSRLLSGGFVEVTRQGRHRYYRLTGPQIGHMLESIVSVANAAPPRYRPRTRREEHWRKARTCYDHFAGLLGVGIADSLSAHGHLVLADEGGDVTASGEKLLLKLGVEIDIARAGRRVFCRPCLDWTERRPHLGGAIGAALATRCFELGWVERMRDKRGLNITPKGERGLLEVFELSL